MVIDQRNAGASVAITDGTVVFLTDRFRFDENTDGAFSGQQVTDAPTGFVNSLKLTVTTADASLAAGQYSNLRQLIEGFNVSDLGWGTANAQTVTLSFWVKSSLTGTFGGSLRSSTSDLSYPFTYAISSANTWELKSITVAGPTTGTWYTDNRVGITVIWGLGVGTTFSGTAGSWQASNLLSATGAVSVVGTNGATFYITGVQLEAGSVATPFERRPYGTELALCQRYYFRITGGGENADALGTYWCISATRGDAVTQFPVTMRIAPTALEQTGTASDYVIAHLATGVTCSAVPAFTRATKDAARTQGTVAGGLTAGNGCSITTISGGFGFLGWSAEL